MHPTVLPLTRPPTVAAAGIGVHRPGPFTRWRLPNLWSFHLYSYHGTLDLEGRRIELRPGRWTVTPAGWRSEYRFVRESRHWYAHFTPHGTGGTNACLWGDFGDIWTAVDRQLRAALAGSPERVQAALWHVLGMAMDGSQGAAPRGPWDRIAAHVAEHLAGPIYVGDLAEAAGVSASTVLRLVRARTGRPATAWIRGLRLERARHLLLASDLPIRAVGEAVGIPDPQAFNKIARAAWGCPPSHVRTQP